MAIKNRIEKLEDSNKINRKCDHIPITPEMSAVEAMRNYRLLVRCDVCHVRTHTIDVNIPPEKAERLYRELINGAA